MESEAGWMLGRERVNGPQADTIARTIELAKHAHYVNVRIRINGEWRELEADWIKHMRTAPNAGTSHE